MGIFATREIRQKDYWPRIACMSYQFDTSAGVLSLTSAQLLILVWKLNLGSTDELSRQAEDEFWHRRERDFAAGLTLKVMDDSSKAISESLCIPSISNLPLSPPRLPPPQHFVNSDSTKFQPPAAILSASPIERSRVDLPIHLPSPALHLPPIASTSKLQQTFIPSEERQTRPTMIKESRDGLGMNYEVERGRKEEQGEKINLKRARSSRSRSPPRGSRSAQSTHQRPRSISPSIPHSSPKGPLVKRKPLPAQSMIIPAHANFNLPHSGIINKFPKLPEALLESKWQLFVSNITTTARFNELRSYFDTPGLCGIRVGAPSSRFSALASWLLYESEEERDNALRRFERCIYPDFRAIYGSDGVGDYVFLKRGEDESRGRNLNQSNWYERDFWGRR